MTENTDSEARLVASGQLAVRIAVLFPPIGISALVYAILAETSVIKHEFDRAHRYAERAAWLALVGAIVGGVLVFLMASSLGLINIP